MPHPVCDRVILRLGVMNTCVCDEGGVKLSVTGTTWTWIKTLTCVSYDRREVGPGRSDDDEDDQWPDDQSQGPKLKQNIANNNDQSDIYVEIWS